jgi:hypothetical protein
VGREHPIVRFIAITIIIIYVGTALISASEPDEDNSELIKEKFLSLLQRIMVLLKNQNYEQIRDSNPWDDAWTYNESITISHMMVEGNLTNFPVLISGISDGVANNASGDGGDIIFVSYDNSTQFNHEIEYYNATTGELIAWVNVTQISAVEDTVIYLYCGNDQCENQQNVSGTWDSDYVGVFHTNQPEGSLVDSAGTQNAQNFEHPAYRQSGQIGFCVELSGYQPGSGTHDGDYFVMSHPAYVFHNDDVTIEAWVNIDQNMFYDDTIVFLGKLSNTNPGPRITLRKVKRNEHNGKLMMQCGQSNVVSNKAFSNENGTDIIGKWIYAAGVVNYSGDELSLFINGDKQVITDSVDDYQFPAGTSVAAMGFDGTGDGITDNWNYLDGSLDEIRISRTARSPEWIMTSFHSMYSPNTFTNFGNAFSLMIFTEGVGEVLKTPDQIAYTNGTVVYLEAIGDPGWSFSHWSGDLSGSTNPDTITMDSDKIVTAHFTEIYYSLGVDVVGSGGVVLDPDGGSYTYGLVVELNASGDEGWYFDHWEGDLSGNTNPEYLTIDDDFSVTAVFSLIPDSIPPVISNVVATPQSITYPNGMYENRSMDGYYYCNQIYSSVGMYSFFIWACDVQGNSNFTSDNIFMITSLNNPPNQPTNEGPINNSDYESVYGRYLTVTASDPDGDNVNVSFYWENGVLIGSALAVSNNSLASIYLPDYIDPG